MDEVSRFLGGIIIYDNSFDLDILLANSTTSIITKPLAIDKSTNIMVTNINRFTS